MAVSPELNIKQDKRNPPHLKLMPHWQEGMAYPTNIRPIREFTGESLYSAVQIDNIGLEIIAQKTEELKLAFENDHPRELAQRRLGRGIFSAFYERSTRSRGAFEIAMQRIGGWVFAESAETSKDSDVRHGFRVIAGEEDTNKGVDIIAFRHPNEGSVFGLLEYATKPFINAGDGNREHVFQAVKDTTFWPLIFSGGKSTDPYYLDNKEYSFYGDNLNSRTNHSTLYLIAQRGEKVKINLVSPPPIQAPDDLVATLGKFGAEITKYDSLDDLQIRNGGPGNHVRVVRPQDNLITDPEMKRLLKEDPRYKYRPITREWLEQNPFTTVDHAMPIYDEIPRDLDFHPQMRHMQLADHGYPTAAALIELIVPE